MLSREEILRWLRERRDEELGSLWERADEVRRVAVGDEVHLRALVEVSSHCVRSCHYCGLRVENLGPARYRMSADEVAAVAGEARRLGFGTIVLQAGEDPRLTRDWVSRLVSRLKRETGMAVTLSLGEREPEDFAAWRDAGADRYLLRFETSDAALYRRIHPAKKGAEGPDRLALLRVLRRLGYEVGSGVMVGLPGQTLESLADDLALFEALDLDMIGVGPYVPHPATPLNAAPTARPDAVLPTLAMSCKVMALARILCPEANIPATTALAVTDPRDGWRAGLSRGANVLMPDLTPARYAAGYDIYPGKAGADAEPARGPAAARALVAELARSVATGPGSRIGRHGKLE